jgi:protein involved in polysaccharide export with SLBB domain
VYAKRVTLTGAVKRPFIYELSDKETIADIIQYSGGFGENAYKESVKMVQNGEREKKIRDITAADFSYIIPRNGDSIHVDQILPRFENRIILTGAVMRPGNYELTEGLTLSGLIKKANGIREDAFTNRGYIKRVKTDGAEKQFLSFDARKILDGKDPDILLVKEDSVYIMAKDSLQDIPTILVGGNVRQPGTYQFRKGISLEDAIILAGGFTNEAATHKVEISRLQKNKSDTLANKLIDLITVNVDSSLQDSKSNTLLEPQDYIFVPRLLNYRNLGSIKLRGEVLYAGDYSLERRDESIEELLARAGGPTPYASLSDAQIYRNNLRVASTVLSTKGQNQYNFLLLPGDSIYIPRNEPFVEVKGEVFNPQILRYQSGSFLSYISDAGGVNDNGNLKKAYIQYSNGVNKQIHRFLFFRSYPKVTAGSKIIVPAKQAGERKGISIIELSALTGILTGIVSMITILKR